MHGDTRTQPPTGGKRVIVESRERQLKRGRGGGGVCSAPLPASGSTCYTCFPAPPPSPTGRPSGVEWRGYGSQQVVRPAFLLACLSVCLSTGSTTTSLALLTCEVEQEAGDSDSDSRTSLALFFFHAQRLGPGATGSFSFYILVVFFCFVCFFVFVLFLKIIFKVAFRAKLKQADHPDTA